MTSGDYLEPEQVWENADLPASPFGSDPTTASIGFKNGQPVGSASPLTWAQATYARLAIDLGAGRNVETPGIVTDRYVTNGMPGSLPVTITSPTGGTTIDSSSVDVSGHDHGGCEGRRGSVRIPGRGGGDRVDHGGRIGELVADAAGQLRLEHDHGDGDARPEHRLCAGVGVELAGAGDDRVQHDGPDG